MHSLGRVVAASRISAAAAVVGAIGGRSAMRHSRQRKGSCVESPGPGQQPKGPGYPLRRQKTAICGLSTEGGARSEYVAFREARDDDRCVLVWTPSTKRWSAKPPRICRPLGTSSRYDSSLVLRASLGDATAPQRVSPFSPGRGPFSSAARITAVRHTAAEPSRPAALCRGAPVGCRRRRRWGLYFSRTFTMQGTSASSITPFSLKSQYVKSSGLVEALRIACTKF